MLDGQVRNAQPRIHDGRAVLIASEQGTGRTRIEAGAAGAAVIPLEGCVRFEVQLQQQHAEEEVGAAARMDEHGIAAEPAEARPPRQLAFQHWTGVDVGSREW